MFVCAAFYVYSLRFRKNLELKIYRWDGRVVRASASLAVDYEFDSRVGSKQRLELPPKVMDGWQVTAWLEDRKFPSLSPGRGNWAITMNLKINTTLCLNTSEIYQPYMLCLLTEEKQLTNNRHQVNFFAKKKTLVNNLLIILYLVYRKKHSNRHSWNPNLPHTRHRCKCHGGHHSCIVFHQQRNHPLSLRHRSSSTCRKVHTWGQLSIKYCSFAFADFYLMVTVDCVQKLQRGQTQFRSWSKLV